jgi:DNA-binding CsgD family transcriptional regulator
MVDRKMRLLFTGFAGAFIVLAVVDVILDTREHQAIDEHIIIESILLACAFISVFLLWTGFRTRLTHTGQTLERVRKELADFRERHEGAVQEMRSAMEDQFARWRFSQTEAKIANALIRGYSLKQIAGMYDKSERTVRNQTVAIYEKSGMTGRSDLAAFFLADLFPEDPDSQD